MQKCNHNAMHNKTNILMMENALLDFFIVILIPHLFLFMIFFKSGIIIAK